MLSSGMLPMFGLSQFSKQHSHVINVDGATGLRLRFLICSGGREFNPAAFSVPLAGQVRNSPHNFLRGFGENEINLALRREFPLKGQLHL